MKTRCRLVGVLGAGAVMALALGGALSAGPAVASPVLYGGPPQCGTESTPQCPVAAAGAVASVSLAAPVVTGSLTVAGNWIRRAHRPATV
jgi:hypothetical protein